MENETSDKPISLPVNLSPGAKQVIERLRKDTGIPARESMSRILEWFAGIDVRFRLAILQRDDEARRVLALDLLREWGHEDQASPPAPPVKGTAEKRSGTVSGLEAESSPRRKPPAPKGAVSQR